MKRLWKKLAKSKNRGQAYIEFVVVLPGLLLTLLLAWEFAYFWWGRMIVSTATFEATRQVAAGEPVASGHTVYNDILTTGMGQMADEHRGRFHLRYLPARHSAYGQARVPYRWPTGLGALMGGGLNLDLRATAFFRLEDANLGPPTAGRWE